QGHAPVGFLVGLRDFHFGCGDGFLTGEYGDLRMVLEILVERLRVEADRIDRGLASQRCLGVAAYPSRQRDPRGAYTTSHFASPIVKTHERATRHHDVAQIPPPRTI